MRRHADEMTGRRMRDRLPPPEVRLYDPRKEGLIETPLDERGLVDLNALVEIGKATVERGFIWESRENDVHHLQWTGRRYDVASAFMDVDACAFRELVNRKAFVPRLLHNYWHYITAPPPIPSEEVMRYSIDAERVAKSLARTAGLAVKLTRNSRIPEKKLKERLDQEFDNYNLYIDNAREVPQEFSLVRLEEVEVHKVDDLLLVSKRLGRLAIDTVPVVRRQLSLVA